MDWNTVGIIAGLISLIVNIVQYQRDKYKYKPLYNSLLGVFNQIKQNTTALFLYQGVLMNPKNPHSEYETLKWDFNQFILTRITDYNGMQEHIVGALKSIDESEDKIFSGQDFGLTDEDKQLKKKFMEESMARQKGVQEAKRASTESQ